MRRALHVDGKTKDWWSATIFQIAPIECKASLYWHRKRNCAVDKERGEPKEESDKPKGSGGDGR